MVGVLLRCRRWWVRSSCSSRLRSSSGTPSAPYDVRTATEDVDADVEKGDDMKMSIVLTLLVGLSSCDADDGCHLDAGQVDTSEEDYVWTCSCEKVELHETVCGKQAATVWTYAHNGCEGCMSTDAICTR